jgi:hypothetical protein
MTTPDPLLERLRQLRRPALDDVAAARTLARAEEVFAAPQAEPPRRPLRARAWIPAALGLWGLLYVWGAVRELVRLFPAAASSTAGVNQRPLTERYADLRSDLFRAADLSTIPHDLRPAGRVPPTTRHRGPLGSSLAAEDESAIVRMAAND